MPTRYAQSQAALERAQNTIPLGAQTFSKSITQFPLGVSPLFAARAKGSRLWDVDGHEYIDFINALAAITLGYGDPDIDAAIAAQLSEGVVFSLSHALEAEVAERICAMVPCAEMVRFGKNGSDATAGAIRIARAATGRDHVLVCGYHGWQDWYIGATARNKGVPQAVQALTHPFPFNDLPALEALLARHEGEVAAIMLEPMNVTPPAPNYLQAVKTLAHKAGAVLIFDEVITGFRFAKGGAQQKFGITPDLACFGKGLANGYPLSAIAGRRDLMLELEEVFFSFTMGGEALSLAAAKATLDKIAREPVLETIAATGGLILDGLNARIEAHQAHAILAASGDPSWPFLQFKDGAHADAWGLRTLYLQEMFARNLLCLGAHNMSYAHTQEDAARLLAAYDDIVPLLRAAAEEEGALARLLRVPPLTPLFRVR